jgi:hypothetical protein
MRLSTNKATRLIQDVVSGNLEIIQPVHWLVEVAAVLARVSPQTAIDDVAMLSAMQFSTNDELNVMRRATALAIETGQPLFDTLHHAVALEQEDAVLVTADDLYRAKGDRYGKIVGLRDWRSPGSLSRDARRANGRREPPTHRR